MGSFIFKRAMILYSCTLRSSYSSPREDNKCTIVDLPGYLSSLLPLRSRSL